MAGDAGLDFLQRGDEFTDTDFTFQSQQRKHATPFCIADEVDVGIHADNIARALYIWA